MGLGLPRHWGGMGREVLPGSAVGSEGSLAAPRGEEGWWWLCRQEELRHFSQAVLAQPSTGPAAHGSPSGPSDRLCRHQVQS